MVNALKSLESNRSKLENVVSIRFDSFPSVVQGNGVAEMEDDGGIQVCDDVLSVGQTSVIVQPLMVPQFVCTPN